MQKNGLSSWISQNHANEIVSVAVEEVKVFITIIIIIIVIIIIIIIIFIIIIIITIIIVIIELTHRKTMLENTVEIEPQPVSSLGFQEPFSIF